MRGGGRPGSLRVRAVTHDRLVDRC